MKGMSSLDMDLIQHDTTESAMLNVIWRYKNSDAWRNVRHRIIPGTTWSQLRRSPAHFHFCIFPTSALPHRTHKHSSNNTYKNNNHGLHVLPKCSSRADIQLSWSARRGTRRSGIHYELSLHRQHWSSDARREQPGATCWKPLLKMCGGLTLLPSPRSRALHGSDKHTQDVRTTE